ncbi:MAG: flavocytochrome c [Desulfitobacterium sp.]
MAKELVGRRQFLKKMALTGVTLIGAGTLAGCANTNQGPSTTNTNNTSTTKTTGGLNWQEETDVIVVGSGFAALSAALEVVEAGSKVIILEKMHVAGGNSTINGGDMCCANTKMQAAAGIKDSVELMVKDMLKAGGNLNHVDKATIVAEKSNEALEWCQNYLGIKFREKLNFHGGHSVLRAHQTENASGSGYIKPMLIKLNEKGIFVAKKRKVTRLIENDEQRIIGVEVRDGYKFGDENSGTLMLIKANKAVILASGGFSQDIQMRVIHEPRLTDKFTSTNHPGATGELLRETLKHNAMDVHLDWIQLGPWTSPEEKGFGYVPQFVERLVGFSPMIDVKTGKRFIMETGNRKVRADAIIALGEPSILVGDEYAVKLQILPKILKGAMEVGAVKKYNTLEEVAKAYKIPVEPFLAEMKRWDSFVQKGKDDDFNTMIMKGAKPTREAPFYVTRLWPKVHHTMGGLVTNVKCQVINQDSQPIKGLYAAGEVTGGVHGAVRLGGVACTDCIVNGRISGQEAAREQPWV